MTVRGPCGIEPDSLVDYLLGELASDAAERLEDHVFQCPACSLRLAEIERVGTAIGDAVRNAHVGANIDSAFLERAIRDGLALREYRIPAGETVTCAAGPEDLVVVRLAADFGDATDLSLDVAFHDLESGTTSTPDRRPIAADRNLGEIVLVLPGEIVRTYPRSRWTLTVHGRGPSGPAAFGPFVMDHTPLEKSL